MPTCAGPLCDEATRLAAPARRPDARRARGARAPRPDRAHRRSPGDPGHRSRRARAARPTRTAPVGDHDDIAAGWPRSRRALRRGQVGEYQLEAAIAACHASAPTYEDTDWEEIASLYGLLLQIDPAPRHPAQPRRRPGRGDRPRRRDWPPLARSTSSTATTSAGRWRQTCWLELDRADEARAAYDRALRLRPQRCRAPLPGTPSGRPALTLASLPWSRR